MRFPKYLSLLIIPIFFIIYAFSALAIPSGFADADELTLTSYFFSVSHPPGFPLFNLVGNLGIKFIAQFSNVSHAANLLSGLYMAVCLYFLYRIGRRLYPEAKFTLPLSATVLTGFSYLCWTYATVYEITAFTAALTTITLYFAVSWYASPLSKTNFYLTWIFAGLLLAHYHLAILIFPALLFLLLSHKPFNLKSFIFGLGTMGLVVLISSAILFLQNRPLDFTWDFSHNFSGWWQHLSRQDYEGIDLETGAVYESAFALPRIFDAVTFRSLTQYFVVLAQHFNYLPLGLAFVGLIVLWQKRRSLFWFLSLLFLFTGPILAAYMRTAGNIFQPNLYLGIAERQFIISELVAGLLILAGLSRFYYRKSISLLLLIFISFQLIRNAPSIVQPNSRQFNYQYLKASLQNLDQNSLVICTTDPDCYGLWYLSLIDHLRPDVIILSHTPTYRNFYLQRHPEIYPFAPAGNPQFLTQLIFANYQTRPIYLTNGLSFYDQYLGLESGPFYLEPSHNFFRLRPDPPLITQPQTDMNLAAISASLDHRDHYPKGILETIASKLAYTGYLALKYNQVPVAKSYFDLSLKLDPSNPQTQELITNQMAIAAAVAIEPNRLTYQDYLSLANQALDTNSPETAATYFRYAALSSPPATEALQLLQQSLNVYNGGQVAPN